MTQTPSIVESLPDAPLPLSLLTAFEEHDRITTAVPLVIGENEGGEDMALQFLVQTETMTHVLTLPAAEDDPQGWHALVTVTGAGDQSYGEAVLEARVWRDERDLPAEYLPEDDDANPTGS